MLSRPVVDRLIRHPEIGSDIGDLAAFVDWSRTLLGNSAGQLLRMSTLIKGSRARQDSHAPRRGHIRAVIRLGAAQGSRNTWPTPARLPGSSPQNSASHR